MYILCDKIKIVMLKDIRQLYEFAQTLTHPGIRRTVTASLGFTIVELLIVVVIIAILSAVVVTAYTGMTRNAKDTSVKSDIMNFQKRIKLYQAEFGNYPLPGNLSASMGIKVSKQLYTDGSGLQNNWYYCANTARTRFAVGATAESSRAGFVYDSETGLRTEAAVWGSSTCPATNASDPYYNSGAHAGHSCTATAPVVCNWQAHMN
jgi:prepilin-type N-terminal cleavage/methylation domain-containing protein